MKKIVIDARESGTTSGRYVDKLLEYLFKIDRTNQYTLLLKSHRLETYKTTPDNFKIVRCDIKEFTFAEQFKFALMLYKIKPDLVHFPMVQQPLLYFGRVVTTMQDLTTLRFRNPTKNPVIFWIMQRAYWLVNFIAPRKSEHVIAISEFTKEDVMKSMRYKRAEKFTVIYESADEIRDKAEPIESLENKEFITYVGRHQPHKNLSRLIDALQVLREKHPNILLAIVGKPDATSEILKKNIKEPGSVVFTGFVSEGQLRWLYENTACYVFPSLSEGFGLPGLEAMKHGAPVASSNATCLPEIYGNGALYFSPYSHKQMAEVIDDVVSNKKLAQDLIRRGRKQAEKYSWEKMARETLEIYNKYSQSK